MGTKFLIATLLSISTASYAAEKTPEVWTPSSEWEVNYAESECRLTREFTNGDSKSQLLIKTELSLDHYAVSLSGAAIPKKSRVLSVGVRLGGNAKANTYPGESGQKSDGSEYILQWYGLPAEAIINGPKDQIMRIEAPIGFAAELSLKNVKAAMSALNICQDDLLRRWKIDPTLYRKLQKQLEPVGNPGNWASSLDYPSSAFEQRKEGIVTFYLRVDLKGKPMDCSILKSSGAADLDKRTCELMMRRAKFKPAIDGQGKPVEAPFISRVRWALPG